MPGPLTGLNVLDFTQHFAGPGTGMFLADMGAAVIKIEPPGGGNDRSRGAVSGGFLVQNRGKRSLVLDIRSPEGREVVSRLVQRSDVMLVAWEPGQAEQLGYSYEAMRALNPRLIYASITGWGTRGPLAMLRGYDRLLQAFTGVMANRPAPDGSPLEASFFVADGAIPMLLAYGIMVALWSREQTGEGQQVETSQLEAQIAMQSIYLVVPEHAEGTWPEEVTTWRPPHTYRTADGRYVVLVPLTEEEWSSLWQCLDLPELARDPALQTRAGRSAQHERIFQALADRFLTRPLDQWLGPLAEAQIPHFPVLTRAQFFDHPHAWQNDMLVEVEHPVAGRTRMMAVPLRLSATPGQIAGPAPGFGQHTSEILQELGYADDEIAALYQRGCVH